MHENGVYLLGSKEEFVVVEEDSNGLNPSEVAFHAFASLSDEVAVHMEVGISDQAEVLVLLAMEVEGDAIATHEAGIFTHCTWPVTICTGEQN